MLKTAITAALALVCVTSTAEARHRHAAAGNGLSPDCVQNGGLLPCEGPRDLRKPIPAGSRIVITMHRDRHSEAKPRPVVARAEPVGPGIVRSVSGAVAHVAASATSAFQCLVSALEGQGYPVKFIGGWRAHGSVRHSLHPLGLAMDVNQVARNVTTPRMPANEIELANSCGLTSGAIWRHADSGHFQVNQREATANGRTELSQRTASLRSNHRELSLAQDAAVSRKNW